MAKQIKSIIERSGLLRLEKVAEIFCLSVDAFSRKWHDGEPIIREIELRRAGKFLVADERNVYKTLDRYKKSLEVVTPRWRDAQSQTQRS